MRRRSPTSASSELMEKGGGKNQHNRLCLLASLSALFWIFLLYFHFVVLAGSAVNESVKLDPTPINPESKTPGFVTYDRLPDNPVKSSPSGSTSEIIPSNVTPSSIVETTRLETTSTSSQKIEKFPFTRALRTVENKSDPCGGRYIYVHDLPSRFNEDMLKECRSLSLWTNMCKFTTDAGMGPPLENVEGVFSNTGWYATNQFAVDVIFSNRMKQYECLTNDSSVAAAIFVPFYAGFDIARYLWGHNVSRRDAASLDLVEWLMKRPEWGIMQGRDHFLVAGRITWDFSIQNGGSDYNLKSSLKNDESPTDGNSMFKSPASTDHPSGIPPIPVSSNQFSARGRMGVRARYVDTFNQGGGKPANLFQSPPVPSVKPAVVSNAKFFVPAPAPSLEYSMEAIAENIQEDSATTEKPSTVNMKESDYPQPSTSSSAMTMQRFPSMDNITRKGDMISGKDLVSSNSRRTASWSGSFSDSFSPPKVVESESPGGAMGMTPSSLDQSMTPMPSSSSFGDELDEVEL